MINIKTYVARPLLISYIIIFICIVTDLGHDINHLFSAVYVSIIYSVLNGLLLLIAHKIKLYPYIFLDLIAIAAENFVIVFLILLRPQISDDPILGWLISLTILTCLIWVWKTFNQKTNYRKQICVRFFNQTKNKKYSNIYYWLSLMTLAVILTILLSLAEYVVL